MWLRNPVDDILSSRAKTAALRVACASTVPLSGRETGRRAHIGPGHVSRVLRELVASGVLVSRDMGRVAAYELACADSALVRRLKELFAAEEARLREVVEGLTAGIPDIVSVVLFGSEARREAKPGSDTDLLFVVEEKDDRTDELIRETCLQVAEQYGVAMSWHVADLANLQRWEETENPFWRNILAQGIRLAGRPLERLTREWQRGKIG